MVTTAPGTSEEQVLENTWDTTIPNRLKSKKTGNTKIEYFYFSNNRIQEERQTDLVTNKTSSTHYSYSYHSNGLLETATIDGPRLDVIDVSVLHYNSSGELTKSVNALGHETIYSNHDSLGRVGTITNPNGLATTITYLPNGEIDTINVGGRVTDYDYHKSGNVSKVTTADGNSVHYVYDDAFRLIKVYNDINDSQNFTHDNMGNVTSVITKEGTTVRYKANYSFDQLGRLKRSDGSDIYDSQYTDFEYFADNNIKTINNNGSHESSFTYTSLGKVDTVTDPMLNNTEYGYNSSAQLNSVIDQESNGTSYVYNGLGQVTSQISPDTGTTLFEYDEAGNLVKKTYSDDSVIRYQYDALNRLTAVAGGDELFIYSYDTGINQKGLLTGTATSNGCSKYEYTQFGELKKQTDTITGSTYVTQYTYTNMGQVQTLTYPSGHKLTYSYDIDGKVSSVTALINGQTKNVVTNVDYYPFGPMKSMNYGNGLTRTLIFDLDYKLQSISTPNVQGLNYSYDLRDNINGITNTVTSANSQTMYYDALDRLDTVTSSSGNHDYNFDFVGNRTSTTISGTSDTYNTASNSNRLLSITRPGTSRVFGYDLKGNITSDTAFSAATKNYTYSSMNRMASFTQSSTSANYYYNVLGQRMKKVVNGTASYFVYGQGGQLQSEGTGRDYIYFNGAPIGLINNGTLFFIHNDHLGRAERITNQSQITKWKASNFAYDRTVTQNNISGYNLGFPGQYYDSEKGSWYNYFRDYDATIGRYLQSDPTGLNGGLNTYLYVFGNPLKIFDPLGLRGVKWTGTLETYTFALGLGGGLLEMNMQSECIAGYKAYAKILTIVGGAGVGGAYTLTGSDIEYQDYNLFPDYNVFNGLTSFGSAGWSWGAGYGSSSLLQKNGASLNQHGLLIGVDISAIVGAGYSWVTEDSGYTSCGCK